MLILSRRAGQGIRIGDTIRVTVVSVDGQFVRLGIEAPASSKILREELWYSIAQDNQAAAVPLSGDFVQALRGPSGDRITGARDDTEATEPDRQARPPDAQAHGSPAR